MNPKTKEAMDHMIHSLPSSVRITGSFNRGSISLDGKYLSPFESLGVIRHSADGFAWGYTGSGPAQLSLAILLHYTRDRDIAVHYHQEFKFQFVSRLPQRDIDETFNMKQIIVDMVNKKLNAS
jgi:hypothetical protein